MVKSVDCFWGGEKCVPGINVACADCSNNQHTPVFISGANKIDGKTRQALVIAVQTAVREENLNVNIN